MLTTTFWLGLLLGLLLGAGLVAWRVYRTARNGGATRPQAITAVFNGGGGPPREP